MLKLYSIHYVILLSSELEIKLGVLVILIIFWEMHFFAAITLIRYGHRL